MWFSECLYSRAGGDCADVSAALDCGAALLETKWVGMLDGIAFRRWTMRSTLTQTLYCSLRRGYSTHSNHPFDGVYH